MNTSCEIIRDLLPLYHDKAISDDGKAIVHTHLASCQSCAEYLKMIRQPTSSQRQYILSDTLHYKAIAARYRKKKAVIKAVMISAGFVCLGAVTYSLAKANVNAF